MDKDHEYFVDNWNKTSTTDDYQKYTYSLEDNWGWFDSDSDELSGRWWNNWLTDDFKATYNLRRAEIWDAQVEKATKDFGPLFATCENGIICQNNVKAEFVKKLRQDWHKVLANFQSTVKAQVTTSTNEIYTAYEALVKCEEDAECCEYDDSVVINHLKKITQWKREIWNLRIDIAAERVKLDEIQNECPDQWEDLEAGKELVDETS